MNALEVAGLKKNYAGFSLDVSFALEEGKITGFIGRNGAGKTTTIKSLLGFVHPDAGDIRFFSMPFTENEMKIKSRLGRRARRRELLSAKAPRHRRGSHFALLSRVGRLALQKIYAAFLS